VLLGLIGDGSAVQNGRLERNGIASSCSIPKTCPGVLDPVTLRRYDAYVFENGESNACIRVTLTAPCSLFSAAYRDSYQPTNLCQNYLADAGATVAGGSRTYSFLAAARSRFVVVVHELDPNVGCNYQLDVDGGSCRPRLNITSLPPNRVALDWTSAAPGYLPVYSNALSNPPQFPWVVLPGTPTISGGRFRMTDVIGPAPTNRFYQLRKP
jgi:hypothetical protein